MSKQAHHGPRPALKPKENVITLSEGLRSLKGHQSISSVKVAYGLLEGQIGDMVCLKFHDVLPDDECLYITTQTFTRLDDTEATESTTEKPNPHIPYFPTNKLHGKSYDAILRQLLLHDDGYWVLVEMLIRHPKLPSDPKEPLEKLVISGTIGYLPDSQFRTIGEDTWTIHSQLFHLLEKQAQADLLNSTPLWTLIASMKKEWKL